MRRLACVLLGALLFAVPGRAAESAAGQAETAVLLGTASPGGTYYDYGKALAALLTKHAGATFADQATQGPLQNILLLDRNKIMLGFVTMGVALQAWNGTGWAKGTQYRSMRAIFPMFDTPFHFAAPKRLGLRSIAELAGKQIAAGPKAGTGGIYFPQILKTLGIAAVLRFGAWEDLVGQVGSGQLDGLAISLGAPMPAAAALDAKDPLDYLEPSPDQVGRLRQEFPEFTPSIIAAGTYPSLARDYHTVGMYNFAVVNKNLPDDLVYRIVKAVFEHQRELSAAHRAARETVPANVDKDTFLPFHPGAARYYREIGVALPASLIATK